MLISFGMWQAVDSPTRVTRTSSTCIDLVLTNVPYETLNVSVVGLGISDHYGQLVEWQTQVEKTYDHRPPQYTYKRDMNDLAIQIIDYQLQKEKWNFTNLQTVDDKFDHFQESIQFVIDSVCPLKRIKKKPVKKKEKGWITPGILISGQTLKNLDRERKYKNTPEFEKLFRKYKSIYRKVIRTAKSTFILNSLKESDNLNKDAWENINSLRGKHKDKEDVNCLNIDGKLTNNPKVISQAFNNYFSKIGGDIAPEQKEPPLKIDQQPQTPTNSMLLRPTNPKEVYDTIKRMKNKSSKDIYGMSNRILRICARSLCEPLSILINESFETGEFPEALKRSLVKPIHKKGPKDELENYRPISIVPTVGKVFETIFLQRLENYIDRNNILMTKQFGFVKNRSITHAVMAMINEIVRHIDRKAKAISVLLDLRKAFDSVSHHTLLERLEQSGIRGVPNQWICSYLTGRTQMVQIKDTKSDEMALNFGVPQGAVLAPTLYNIYVNNVVAAIQHSEIVLYADDIVLNFGGTSISDLEINVNIKLAKAFQYLNNLNLQINSTKTNYIEFKIKDNYKSPFTVAINGELINEKEVVTYLGLRIDSKLTWEQHIDYVCGRISSSIFVLRRLAYYRNYQLLKLYYSGVIEALLTYGVAAWGGATRQLINRLFILQKKAVRILAGLRGRESCRTVFKEHSILTLSSLYILEVTVFARFESGASTGQQIHSHNTRARSQPRQEQHRCRLAATLPQNAGVALFNKLPEELRNIQEKARFKCRLKKHLVELSCYSVEEFVACHQIS